MSALTSILRVSVTLQAAPSGRSDYVAFLRVIRTAQLERASGEAIASPAAAPRVCAVKSFDESAAASDQKCSDDPR